MEPNSQPSLPMEGISPATKLLEKRRLMYEIQESFERAKDDEKQREEVFKTKEAQLRARDLFIQEQLITFNKFLQDNEIKKARANKRYEDENKGKKQKEEKYEKLRKEIKKSKKENHRLERQVQNIRKYEDYLELVRDRNPDDFQDISEILNRYNTLKDANTDLTNKKNKLELQLDEKKRERDHYEKSNKDKQLEINIEITVQQKRLDDMEGERIEKTKNAETDKNARVQKNLELGRMLDAIDNLFDRCKRDGIKVNYDQGMQASQIVDKDSFLDRANAAKGKLTAIQQYYQAFKEVIEDFRTNHADVYNRAMATYQGSGRVKAILALENQNAAKQV